MTASIVAMMTIQRFPVRATTSAGTTPSESGGLIGFAGCAANGASRYEQEEIKSQPAEEQKRNGDAGENKSADGPVSEGLHRLIRSNRRRNVIG